MAVTDEMRYGLGPSRYRYVPAFSSGFGGTSGGASTGGASGGQRIGVKPAGGIRTSKDAIKYLVTVAETVGEEWLQPHLFRFGVSSLLNDVLLQRQKLNSGHYSGPDYVTVD